MLSLACYGDNYILIQFDLEYLIIHLALNYNQPGLKIF